MKKKSIILVDNSPLVSGMLRRVIDDVGDLEIVAEVEDISQYPAIAQQMQAGWTILLIDPDEEVPQIVEQVLSQQPAMRLLVMSVDGSQVRMKWIEPHEISLNDRSLEELLGILQENQVNRIE